MSGEAKRPWVPPPGHTSPPRSPRRRSPSPRVPPAASRENPIYYPQDARPAATPSPASVSRMLVKQAEYIAAERRKDIRHAQGVVAAKADVNRELTKVQSAKDTASAIQAQTEAARRELDVLKRQLALEKAKGHGQPYHDTSYTPTPVHPSVEETLASCREFGMAVQNQSASPTRRRSSSRPGMSPPVPPHVPPRTPSPEAGPSRVASVTPAASRLSAADGAVSEGMSVLDRSASQAAPSYASLTNLPSFSKPAAMTCASGVAPAGIISPVGGVIAGPSAYRPRVLSPSPPTENRAAVRSPSLPPPAAMDATPAGSRLPSGMATPTSSAAAAAAPEPPAEAIAPEAFAARVSSLASQEVQEAQAALKESQDEVRQLKAALNTRERQWADDDRKQSEERPAAAAAAVLPHDTTQLELILAKAEAEAAKVEAEGLQKRLKAERQRHRVSESPPRPPFKGSGSVASPAASRRSGAEAAAQARRELRQGVKKRAASVGATTPRTPKAAGKKGGAASAVMKDGAASCAKDEAAPQLEAVLVRAENEALKRELVEAKYSLVKAEQMLKSRDNQKSIGGLGEEQLQALLSDVTGLSGEVANSRVIALQALQDRDTEREIRHAAERQVQSAATILTNLVKANEELQTVVRVQKAEAEAERGRHRAERDSHLTDAATFAGEIQQLHSTVDALLAEKNASIATWVPPTAVPAGGDITASAQLKDLLMSGRTDEYLRRRLLDYETQCKKLRDMLDMETTKRLEAEDQLSRLRETDLTRAAAAARGGAFPDPPESFVSLAAESRAGSLPVRGDPSPLRGGLSGRSLSKQQRDMSPPPRVAQSPEQHADPLTPKSLLPLPGVPLPAAASPRMSPARARESAFCQYAPFLAAALRGALVDEQQRRTAAEQRVQDAGKHHAAVADALRRSYAEEQALRQCLQDEVARLTKRLAAAAVEGVVPVPIDPAAEEVSELKRQLLDERAARAEAEDALSLKGAEGTPAAGEADAAHRRQLEVLHFALFEEQRAREAAERLVRRWEAALEQFAPPPPPHDVGVGDLAGAALQGGGGGWWRAALEVQRGAVYDEQTRRAAAEDELRRVRSLSLEQLDASLRAQLIDQAEARIETAYLSTLQAHLETQKARGGILEELLRQHHLPIPTVPHNPTPRPTPRAAEPEPEAPAPGPGAGGHLSPPGPDAPPPDRTPVDPGVVEALRAAVRAEQRLREAAEDDVRRMKDAAGRPLTEAEELANMALGQERRRRLAAEERADAALLESREQVEPLRAALQEQQRMNGVLEDDLAHQREKLARPLSDAEHMAELALQHERERRLAAEERVDAAGSELRTYLAMHPHAKPDAEAFVPAPVSLPAPFGAFGEPPVLPVPAHDVFATRHLETLLDLERQSHTQTRVALGGAIEYLRTLPPDPAIPAEVDALLCRDTKAEEAPKAGEKEQALESMSRAIMEIEKGRQAAEAEARELRAKLMDTARSEEGLQQALEMQRTASKDLETKIKDLTAAPQPLEPRSLSPLVAPKAVTPVPTVLVERSASPCKVHQHAVEEAETAMRDALLAQQKLIEDLKQTHHVLANALREEQAKRGALEAEMAQHREFANLSPRGPSHVVRQKLRDSETANALLRKQLEELSSKIPPGALAALNRRSLSNLEPLIKKTLSDVAKQPAPEGDALPPYPGAEQEGSPLRWIHPPALSSPPRTRSASPTRGRRATVPGEKRTRSASPNATPAYFTNSKERQQLEEARKRAEDALAQKDKELLSERTRIRTLQDRLKECRLDAKRSAEERKALENEIAALEKDLSSAHADLRRFRDTTYTVADWRKRVNEKTEKISALEEKVLHLQAELRKAKKNARAAKDDAALFLKERNAAFDETSLVEHALRNAVTTLKTDRDRVTDLQQHLEEVEDSKRMVEDDMHHLKAALLTAHEVAHLSEAHIHEARAKMASPLPVSPGSLCGASPIPAVHNRLVSPVRDRSQPLAGTSRSRSHASLERERPPVLTSPGGAGEMVTFEDAKSHELLAFSVSDWLPGALQYTCNGHARPPTRRLAYDAGKGRLRFIDTGRSVDLPGHSQPELMQRLRALAEQAGVPHNFPARGGAAVGEANDTESREFSSSPPP